VAWAGRGRSGSCKVGFEETAPLGDAVGAGRVDAEAANPEAGYGVSIVPLQYVSAQTILKLMDSFATRPGSVRADPTRNMLLIQGTGAERRTAVDTAMSFDVDWMRGQSVGIYPVSNSAPEPIITELEKIMDSGDSGLSQSVVKFQPISRLNAILVVSRKPALLLALALFCAASFVCAVAPGIETLIIARGVQALGAAGVVLLPRAIVRDLHAGDAAGRELSRMGAIMSLVPVMAPLIGGVVQAAFGWRAIKASAAWTSSGQPASTGVSGVPAGSRLVRTSCLRFSPWPRRSNVRMPHPRDKKKET